VSDDLILRDEFDAGAIAAQRSAPRVFLVDERGELLAWSAQSAGVLEPEVRDLVRRRISEPDGAIDVTELVRTAGGQVSVRILPQHLGVEKTFAVVVERFALRERSPRRA
jgi:hypothetical protein